MSKRINMFKALEFTRALYKEASTAFDLTDEEMMQKTLENMTCPVDEFYTEENNMTDEKENNEEFKSEVEVITTMLTEAASNLVTLAKGLFNSAWTGSVCLDSLCLDADERLDLIKLFIKSSRRLKNLSENLINDGYFSYFDDDLKWLVQVRILKLTLGNSETDVYLKELCKKIISADFTITAVMNHI